jgi:hypothetical protein
MQAALKVAQARPASVKPFDDADGLTELTSSAYRHGYEAGQQILLQSTLSGLARFLDENGYHTDDLLAQTFAIVIWKASEQAKIDN